MRHITALGCTVGVVLAGCSGEAETGTITGSKEARRSHSQAARVATPSTLTSFAYSQMEKQSRKTCRVVPRRVLAQGFARAGDPNLGGSKDPAGWSDHYVALSYAEDVKISPIRLQQAAYDGCMTGLAARK